MSELPLFPLQTVLFPDGRLALRVFEPRYLDMVARCLRGENRFGVIAIREGAEVGVATTYDFGTSAEIVDWQQESGGMLGIVAAGRTTCTWAR
jgi:Lon protease-like protein